LRDDSPEKYQSQFTSSLGAGVEPEDLEKIYTDAHAAIRADPSIKLTEKKVPEEKRTWKMKKLSYDERKANLVARLKAVNEDDE
jgi:large subunit ribosomal protein L5e